MRNIFFATPSGVVHLKNESQGYHNLGKLAQAQSQQRNVIRFELVYRRANSEKPNGGPQKRELSIPIVLVVSHARCDGIIDSRDDASLAENAFASIDVLCEGHMPERPNSMREGGIGS